MNYECRINLKRHQAKIERALKEGKSCCVTLDPSELEGKDKVFLTQAQRDRLYKTGKLHINKTFMKKQSGGFLGALMSIASKILPALGIGALTGLASAGTEKILGSGLYIKKKGHGFSITQQGSGLFLQPHQFEGTDGVYLDGKLYGKGLILGKNSPFKNIPILGWIL